MTAPKFAEDTQNGRYYFKPGRSDGGVPSVTNIKRRQNKPAINSFMVRKAAEYAVDSRERLAALTRSEQITLITKSQYEKTDASLHGDLIHDLIDRFVKGDAATHEEVQEQPQTVRWMWDSFLKFNSHYKPEYTGSEFTVWSHEHSYAGTADLSFTLGGYHVLCDTKSGKRPYPDTAMQLAALAHADTIITEDGEKPNPHYDRYAILSVRPRGVRLVPVFKIEEAWECFLALKVVFDWELNCEDSTLGDAPKVA